MIIKSWKFKGFDQDMPDWVQENSGKRLGNQNLFVYTQEGELPCQNGEWVAINLRGHLTIHPDKPHSTVLMVGKEIAGAIAFGICALAFVVIMLAM